MEILRTERLLLREFTIADAAFVLELLNDPDWHRFINDPGVRDVAQAQTWMESRLFEPYRRLGHGFWAVERLCDGELLGLCGLFKRDSLPEVDLGYALLPRYRGQGYVREAAAACLTYGRKQLGLASILAITAVDNAASGAVLEGVGMKLEETRLLNGYEEPSRIYRWTSAD